jgi:hypothetical protein
MCRATGIEDIAKDSGLIKNGEIAVLKDYSGVLSWSNAMNELIEYY